MAIERKRHENLILRLERLRTHTKDAELIRRIDAEIRLLTETYEQYHACIAKAKRQDKLYRIFHQRVYTTTFKKKNRRYEL